MQAKEHPLKGIRRASVPLAIFETSDPAKTIAGCGAVFNGKADSIPMLQWDIARTLRPLTGAGTRALQEILGDKDIIETANPCECLKLLEGAPEGSIIFWHNIHRYIAETDIIQALWNLRDVFKSKNCLLLGLCPGVTVPEELKHDCVVVAEPLPDAERIGAIVTSIATDAELPPVADDDKAGMVDTLLGLSGFAAEQALALSVVPGKGFDRDGLWERKRKMIEQTPGLSVWRGGETFADIGGCDNVKGFLKRILAGNAKPRAIGFIDEIEKGLAGASGDTSGVSQDQLQCFLTYMQDKQIPGMIFIGPPGAAKSAIAKAAGNEAGIPTVALDLGAMKGSLVGESERRLRSALQVFSAVSQDRGLFIATCNSIGVLPPELRRRFTLGTFFFDLPNDTERAAIWDIYRKKYSTTGEPGPAQGWTGAEVKAACDVAWRTGLPIAEAQGFIVPVCKSAGDKIEALRKQADGKFISASVPGFFTLNMLPGEAQALTQGGRKFKQD
jgi:hypothetical protein